MDAALPNAGESELTLPEVYNLKKIYCLFNYCGHTILF
jgi:hypothetical protein